MFSGASKSLNYHGKVSIHEWTSEGSLESDYWVQIVRQWRANLQTCISWWESPRGPERKRERMLKWHRKCQREMRKQRTWAFQLCQVFDLAQWKIVKIDWMTALVCFGDSQGIILIFLFLLTAVLLEGILWWCWGFIDEELRKLDESSETKRTILRILFRAEASKKQQHWQILNT